LRKILVIAAREFGAAVKTKAFLVSLVLMPLLMFGGILVQRVAGKMGDVKDKRVAVVDRTPGGTLADTLERAASYRNESGVLDKKTGRQDKPRIVIERVEPADADDPQAVAAQRFELSERARKGELFAFVEIGSNLLSPDFKPSTVSNPAELAKKAENVQFWQVEDLADEMLGDDDTYRIRYSTIRPTNTDVRGFLSRALQQAVWQKRMQAAGLPFDKVMPLLRPATLSSRGLMRRDASGAIVDTKKDSQVASFLVPMVLIMLMFMIVMVGASPMTTNLVEEKQLKIAEVLLGSVRPFQLMMGKLIGGVGVALTLGVIYFGGAYLVGRQYGVDEMISPALIGWFLFFTVIGTLMYGAMFVAAGAAVTNVKEAQTMITPVILLIVLPIFVLQNLITDPGGTIATAGSFFPTSAPMVTVARLAVPPGIPLWQTLLSALVSLLTTVAIVWAAGRIFRVGILMQGQGAKVGEMLRWVVRG
jgi:ABC-2 type transport system permease protein